MRRLLRAAVLAWTLLIVIGGCTFPPLETPTPSPSPSPTASPSPTPAATASPSPTPDPTPGAADLPSFTSGEIVSTTLDGLRVRQRPGLNTVVVAGLLPLATELEVVMGPILAESNGWFSVRDADPDEPEFGEGWIASGFAPDFYLAATGRSTEDERYVAGFAQTGNAEYGPIEIAEGDHLVRWIAVDPERTRCQLSVSLGPAGSTEPVPAIRATVGNGIDPGTLQPASFAALGVRGPTFVFVESDCSWALVILRAAATVSPSPSASASAAP